MRNEPKAIATRTTGGANRAGAAANKENAKRHQQQQSQQQAKANGNGTAYCPPTPATPAIAAAAAGAGRVPNGAAASGNQDGDAVTTLVATFADTAQTFLAQVGEAAKIKEAQLAESRAHRDHLDAECTSLQSSLAAAQSQFDDVSAQLAEWRTKHAEVEAAAQELAGQLDAAREAAAKERTAHVTEMSETAIKMGELEALLTEAAEDIEDKEKNIETLTGSLAEAADELARWEAQHDEWQAATAQWDQERERTAAERAELDQAMALRAAELEVLREEASRKTELIGELEEQLGAATDSLHAREAEINQVRSALDELQQEHTALKDAAGEMEAALEERTAALHDAESERDTHAARVKELEEYTGQANHEMETLNQSLDAKEAELVRVTGLLEDVQVERSRLEADVDRLTKQAQTQRETVELLSNQVDEEAAAKAQLAAQLDEERKRNAQLAANGGTDPEATARAVAEKDKEIADLKKQLEDMRRRNAPLLVPKVQGPGSVMSTSSNIYSTLERLGIKRKAPGGGAAPSEAGTGFRSPGAGAALLANKRMRLESPLASGSAGAARRAASVIGGPTSKPRAADEIDPDLSAASLLMSRIAAGRANTTAAAGTAKSVAGRSEYQFTPSASGAPASTSGRPTVPVRRAGVVVTFSGFRDTLPEYTLAVREKLAQHIEALGGVVKLESESLDTDVTHIVTPGSSHTFKVLAGVLMHRWIIFDPQWILDSVKAGKFITPEKYGKRVFATPFKGKTLAMTQEFLTENVGREFRMTNATALVEQCGKGTVTKDPTTSTWVLTSTSDTKSYSGTRLDWTGFIKLIMPQDATRS
ncbi:hypothetical protein H9P43_003134 [Blastocladiella emersonii ATCC 22665]|nr:hypothetical protein H9P43_003134 [Blastocladiella emersonii ATCC 22665]